MSDCAKPCGLDAFTTVVLAVALAGLAARIPIAATSVATAGTAHHLLSFITLVPLVVCCGNGVGFVFRSPRHQATSTPAWISAPASPQTSSPRRISLWPDRAIFATE